MSVFRCRQKDNVDITYEEKYFLFSHKEGTKRKRSARKREFHIIHPNHKLQKNCSQTNFIHQILSVSSENVVPFYEL